MNKVPVGDSKVAAVRFRSEPDFDRGVDLLISKQEPFDVIGFNALMIPATRMKKAEKILRAAGLDFAELNLRSRSGSSKGRSPLLGRERNTSPKKGLQKAS